MEFLNYKRFKTVFMHLLNNRSIKISDISRNAGFNRSYLYNLVNHSQNRVSVKTVTRIFKGMNYNPEQINDLIMRIKLVHPVHTHTNYMQHHRRNIKIHVAKEAHYKHKHEIHKHRIAHNKRYKMNGIIMHQAKKLNIYDKETVIIMINRLLHNEQSIKELDK